MPAMTRRRTFGLPHGLPKTETSSNLNAAQTNQDYAKQGGVGNAPNEATTKNTNAVKEEQKPKW